MVKYHENKIKLQYDGDALEISSASFTILDFKISEGQENPECPYAPGQVVELADGGFSFSVGRHATEEVATWFSSILVSSQTTFDHNPGSLNFAFLGNLTVTFSNADSLSFSSIMLAQGTKGNNWWFGGKYANHDGNDTVKIVSDNGEVEASFFRGGDSIHPSTVKVKISKLSWMKAIDDSTKLSSIMMPGCHNAGMSECHNNGIVPSAYVECQEVGVGEQMKRGARYFDIRIDLQKGKLVTYHRNPSFDNLGGDGQDVKDILEETKCFLDNYPTEFVIFSLTVRDDNDEETSSEIFSCFKELVKPYDKYLYKSSSYSVNLAECEIQDFRGKLIIKVPQKTQGVDAEPKDGYFSSMETSGVEIQGSYANTDEYDEMKEDQVEKWEENQSAWGGDYLFLLSWTLTQQAEPEGVLSNESRAKEANKHLASDLEESIASKGLKKPNIVFVDYLTQNEGLIISEYNNFKSP